MDVELTLTEYLSFLKGTKERDLFWTYTGLLAMSVDGKCIKTQIEIAEALGVHPSTIFKRIKELNGITVKGHPLVTTMRDGESNIYFVLTVVTATTSPHGLNMPDGLITDSNTSLDSNKELKDVAIPTGNHPCGTATNVIKYFCSQYYEQFGEKYMPVWSRDTKNVRDKISKVYEPDDIKETIDVLMRLYTKMWAKQGFPRPNIGGMVAFQFQQAHAYAQANQKEAEANAEFEDAEITAEDGQDIFDIHDRRFGL